MAGKGAYLTIRKGLNGKILAVMPQSSIPAKVESPCVGGLKGRKLRRGRGGGGKMKAVSFQRGLAAHLLSMARIPHKVPGGKQWRWKHQRGIPASGTPASFLTSLLKGKGIDRIARRRGFGKWSAPTDDAGRQGVGNYNLELVCRGFRFRCFSQSGALKIRSLGYPRSSAGELKEGKEGGVSASLRQGSLRCKY